jgi:hypothetical protein
MINLKTHTVYPELQGQANNVIQVKLLNAKGKAVFEDMVVGRTKEESMEKAQALIVKHSNKYKV